MKTTNERFDIKPAALVAAALLTLGAFAPNVSAQVTDLAQTPLVTAAPTSVKPNLMFILDDSGSMAWDYMPDDAGLALNRYGRKAAQCNGLAYNPAITYSVPVDASGVEMAPGAFPSPSTLPGRRDVISAAPSIATGSVTVTLTDFGNGDYFLDQVITIYSGTDESRWMLGTITGGDYNTNQLVINVVDTSGGTGTLSSPRVALGDVRPYYYTYSGTAPRLDYAAGTTSTFYSQCNSVLGSNPGAGVFTRVTLTPATATNNYRNWYTYHRTRMLTMRTAASRAFKGIGSDFRVGFSTINSRAVDGTKFLDVADFDATQKTTWYSRLFGSDPNSSTPLRGALSKAGMYFAKKGFLESGSAQTYDPMQYSCQKNFAILTTDGYWNVGNETSTYGPLKLDRSTLVGQQDATAARPMRDAGTATIQTRTSLLQERNTSTQQQSATVRLQATELTLSTRTRSGGGSWSGWTVTTSCTPSNGNPRVECGYSNNWSNWADVSSCTVQGTNAGPGGTFRTGRDCRYTTSAWTNVASCTPTSPGPSAGSPYTVGTATICQSLTNTGPWTNTNSCTPSSTKGCQYAAWSNWATATACTPTPQSTAPNYIVGTARECRDTSTGGSSDSLADIAMYYYETDLRTSALGNCRGSTGSDVCLNNVKQRGADTAVHQHLTTFTLGMGVNGTLGYHPNYLGGQSSDFEAIKAGTKNWPNHDTADLNKSEPQRIDDLWHAAVNGRGQYFSAGDPDVLARSLGDALTAIEARNGTAAAAATSTLQPVPGENNAEYVTSYTTVSWVGDLSAYQVDPISGNRSSTRDWSAQEKLDARVAAGQARNIKYMQRTAGGNTGTLRDFTYANLASDSLEGNFDGFCTKSPKPTQCTSSGYDEAGANQGNNLVNWLRGSSDYPRYRRRDHVLGDTVGGAPVYVGNPPFSYSDSGYQTFASDMKASNGGAGRTGVVYVPSNGGMLHAFKASDGEEMWAYVPSMIMSRMYQLADTDYANKHQYYVNATPVIGDVWVPSMNKWRTILVGGLGAGGRGYYALDVTDPTSPQALWEFSNDTLGGANNLGYSFGNPIITKRADGRWVVLFTSGYNNVSPGNGNGILFMVDARTGDLLQQVPTRIGSADVGSSTTPSGLSKINAWIDSQRDNTAKRVYGGDLLGNVWRFDIDGVVQPNNAALRLATLSAGSPAVAQPVTTRPELGTVISGGLKYPVVFVGTGKMLGLTDLSTSNQQSLYAFKDPMANTELGNLHARTDMVVQTLTINAADRSRTVTNLPIDWAAKTGWRIDFPLTGERVNIDMRLALSTLVVGTNAPTNEICSEGGGSSYLYTFDYSTGGAVVGANSTAGISLGGAYVVGIGMQQLYDNSTKSSDGVINTCVQLSDGSRLCKSGDAKKSASVDGRRTSWRELIN